MTRRDEIRLDDTRLDFYFQRKVHMSTAIQSQPDRAPTIRDHLESPAFIAQIAKILPKHVTPERMARAAATALMRTPRLAECDQASFFRAMLDLSQWGLEPDGRRAHLIPFNNSKRGVYEVQLIIDYKGLVELVLRSGLVASIHADVVCENDDFECDKGQVVRHKIDYRKPRGPAYAAYAVVRMKDGVEKSEVLSRDEIEGIRRRSKAGNNGPWVTDWNEMAKKTAFRRVSKWLPLSADIRDATERDDDVLIDGTVRREAKAITSLEDLTAQLVGAQAAPEPVSIADAVEVASDGTLFDSSPLPRNAQEL